MKILVIEDELDIAAFIQKGLQAETCIVEVATSGKEGIALAHANSYNVIVLDFHLRDMIGTEISARIREKKPSIPILVLSVERNMDIKINMLSVCDDYMTKPFSLRELLVRLHALTRRGEVLHGEILEAGDLVMNSQKHSVTLVGKPITLRNKEFALLEYFMQHTDIIVSREMILEYVWDINIDPFTNTVDTHVRLLRKKLETKGRKFIHTVPKRGYRFSGNK
jgi:two-component system, OmpR family, copper resistance phosphate regulon response regulator CusR